MIGKYDYAMLFTPEFQIPWHVQKPSNGTRDNWNMHKNHVNIEKWIISRNTKQKK